MKIDIHTTPFNEHPKPLIRLLDRTHSKFCFLAMFFCDVLIHPLVKLCIVSPSPEL